MAWAVKGYSGVVFSCILLWNIAQVVSEEALWPNLSCHAKYDKAPLKEQHDFCKEGIDNWEYFFTSMKACVLNRLGRICPPDGDPLPAKWQKDATFEIMLGRIIAGGGQNKDDPVVKKVAGNVEACKGTFDQVVREDEEKWTPFFDCVEKATGC